MKLARWIYSAILLLGLAAAWPTVSGAQVTELRAGVVKILVAAPAARTGAGIIVRRDAEEAWIVTAAHVVTDADKISVQFSDGGTLLTAEIRNIEFDNPAHGLALLKVTGALPAQVVALTLTTDVTVSGGEQVTMVGHQASTGDWGMLTGTVSGWKGRELVIQAPIQEQASGGPVILNGRVVGLVQSKDPTGSFGYASTAQAIREYAEGNKVSLAPAATLSRAGSERPAPAQPPLAALLGSSSVDSLRALRETATQLGGIEHVADDETVPITAYPSLLEVQLYPIGTLSIVKGISLTPGQSLDMRFKDSVFGVGIYYKQGLYSSNFNIYYQDGTQKVVVGRGYFPETEFFGEASAKPIARIIVQTQALGNITLAGIYVFAKSRHARVLQQRSQ